MVTWVTPLWDKDLRRHFLIHQRHLIGHSGAVGLVRTRAVPARPARPARSETGANMARRELRDSVSGRGTVPTGQFVSPADRASSLELLQPAGVSASASAEFRTRSSSKSSKVTTGTTGLWEATPAFTAFGKKCDIRFRPIRGCSTLARGILRSRSRVPEKIFHQGLPPALAGAALVRSVAKLRASSSDRRF
jgi:hypothetical protein